jgi:hypothetical protein
MKMTTEKFIERCSIVHDNFYDYSVTQYESYQSPVQIICPKHGQFSQRPAKHLTGMKCKKCAYEQRKTRLKTTKGFIVDAQKVHGNKYDYTRVNYINDNEKIEIVCKKHGSFWQRPSDHLRNKAGCPKCKGEKIILLRTKPVQTFVKQAQEVHGNKYDYSKVAYKNTHTKVCIVCPKHGEFWQKPNAHISSQQGCPACKESKGERQIRLWLEEKQIQYIPQQKFTECINNETNCPLRFDFYLPNHNTCIEFDGKQHFKEGIGILMNGRYVFTFTDWKKLSMKDAIKNQYCNERGIKLIRIAYNQSAQISVILENQLSG